MKHLLTIFLSLFVVQMASAQFTLVAPVDSTVAVLDTAAIDTITIQWTELAGATGYQFHLDLPGGDFSMPLFSSDTVPDTFLLVPVLFLDSTLGTLNVMPGDTITLDWTVTAEPDSGTTFADTTYVITLVRVDSTTTSMREVATWGASLNLYPNPATSALRFSVGDAFSSTSTAVARITDIAGRQVWQQEYASTELLAPQEISLSELSPGVYTFGLEVDGQRASRMLKIE